VRPSGFTTPRPISRPWGSRARQIRPSRTTAHLRSAPEGGKSDGEHAKPGRGARAWAGALATGSPRTEPTKEALDQSLAPSRGLSGARLHSLWLNSAALATTKNGELEAGGRVERDESGEPTRPARGVPPGTFRDSTLRPPRRRWSTDARGGSHRNRRGVHPFPDKDGLARRARDVCSGYGRGAHSTSVWPVDPGRTVSDLQARHPRAASATTLVRSAYLEGVMDVDTRLADSAPCFEAGGVQITSKEDLARSRGGLPQLRLRSTVQAIARPREPGGNRRLSRRRARTGSRSA